MTPLLRTVSAAMLLFLVGSLPTARAQSSLTTGAGFNVVGSTAQGFGLGFRGRVARPINQDVSLGGSLGITGFVFEGRKDAHYLFDPQVSLIVTISSPAPNRAMYVLGGFGAYLPAGDHEDRSGPTIHGGVGWVVGLSDTRLFYEVDPALVIGESRIDLAVPFRIGVIF